ncbi:ankyrin repeat domain-containing protein 50-like [Mytilus trossulus]|uniref:ankyrin repeat domain-containing protein 50-like n=1 Tax=Mytilus trossulus TaxID=6551 RepID=UPI0030054F97
MLIANLLIEEGADINSTDNDGNTPLLLSCKYEDIAIGILLINKGCDIHKSDNDGMTPLMNACRRRRLPIRDRLINEGADIDIPDNNGNTPLSFCCENDNLFHANILLNLGCEINKPNNDGMTPLMKASLLGHLRIVARLIEGSAENYITDKNRETSLTLASKGGFNDIVNLLLQTVSNEH